ncbi:hypothetical protein D3C87_102140 [compost metagenome]
MKTWIISFLIVLMLLPGISFGGAVITYHGRLVGPDGQPVESNSVSFNIQVLSPASRGSCILYEEQRTLSMVSSDGIFVIPIGDGTTARTPNDPGFLIEKIFSNSDSTIFEKPASWPAGQYFCNSGTSYQPSSLDGRQLVVRFKEGTGAWQTLPNMDINFVPLAVNSYDAQNVGGIPGARLLRVETGVTVPEITQAQLNSMLSPDLSDLVAGTSTSYTKPADLTNFVTKPSMATGAGNALRWNGTTWDEISVGASGGSVTSVASENLYLTVTDGTTDAQLRVNVGTAANTVAAGNDSRFTTLANDISTLTTTVGGKINSPATCSAGQFLSFISATDWTCVNAPSSADKLPLAGGTMSGDINMGTQNITQLGNISGTSASLTTASLHNVQFSGAVPGSPVEGTVWYEAGSLKFRDGTQSRTLSITGTGVQSINALSDQTHSLTVTVGGSTAPAITHNSVAGVGVHDLQIPAASTNGVTAGLLSNADYAKIGNATKIQDRDVAATAPTANQVLTWTGAEWEPTDLPAGSTGTVSSVTASAPLQVTGTATVTPNVKITDGSAAGQTLRWSGAAWTAAKLDFADLANTIGFSPFPTTSCGASQFVQWNVVTDSFTCAALPIATAASQGVMQVGAGLGVTAGTVSVTYGTTAGTSAQGNDSRFTSLATDLSGKITEPAVCTAGQILSFVSASDWSCINAPSSTDKLPLAGGTMTGDIDMGTQNITQLGNISGTSASLTTVSTHNVQFSGAVPGAPVEGTVWYESGTLKYRDSVGPKTLGVSGAGLQSINALTDQTQNFSVTVDGTTVPTFAHSSSAGVGTHELKIPAASTNGVTAGLISNADYAKIGDATKIQNRAVAATAPTANQVLTWTGATWEPAGLPVATTSAQGVMQVGTGLGVTAGTVSVTYGTTAGTSVQGNDSRFTTLSTDLSGKITEPAVCTAGQILSFVSASDWSCVNAPSSADKLPLGGGTMTGSINMGTGDISQVGTLTATNLAAQNLHFLGTPPSSPAEGTVWYESGTLKYQDGSTTQTLGVAGSGIQSINALSDNSHSFTVTVGGATAPAYAHSSVASLGTHDLQIPLASSAGVTAGLLSNTDYAKIGDATKLQSRDVAATAPTANQVLTWTGAEWEPTDLPTGNAGTVTSVAATAPLQVTGTATVTPTVKITDGSATGQTLRWTGAAWAASKLDFADLANTIGVTPFPTGSCGVSQFVQWNVITDSFSCAALPVATTSSQGVMQVGTGLSVSTGTVSVAYGTTAGTSAEGNDSRFTTLANDIATKITAPAGCTGGQILNFVSASNWSCVNPPNSTDKLPLGGGTMTGNIDMGTNDISQVGTLTATNLAAQNLHFLGTPPSSPAEGTVWYESGSLKFQDGSTTKTVSVTGTGVQGINSLSDLNHSFSVAVGAGPTEPSYSHVSSAGVGTHSLTLPLASGAGVTAGLLSNTDYLKIGDATKIQNRAVASTAPTTNQVMTWTGATWEPADLPAGNAGTVTSVAAQAPLTVTGTASVTPSVKITDGSTTGQTLRWSGAAWTAAKLDFADLANTIGVTPFPTTSCGASQYVQWNVITDSFTCTALPVATAASQGVMQVGTGLSVTTGTVSVSFGTTAGTSVQGNDARLNPAGADTQVQFNNAGSHGASADLTWNDSTKALAVGGSVSATGSFKGGFLAHSSLNTNFTQGNIQSTTAAAGTLTFTANSMSDGANYTLILKSTGDYYLSTTTSSGITTWKCLPTCPGNKIVATGDTVVSIIKAGTTGYVSWLPGF